jgi:transposase
MARNEDIDLWALDEVHFQQHGSRCRMWVPPEDKDPVLLHHPTRKSVGYFGAVRLRDGKLVYRREDERFNAQTFFVFMKSLRTIGSRSGRRVIVIADNVRYHHARLHACWREQAEDTFSLLFLPPYSPDMNPIERVWKLTRRQATHNRYFPELQSIIDAVEDTFHEWRTANETLRRLCAIT